MKRLLPILAGIGFLFHSVCFAEPNIAHNQGGLYRCTVSNQAGVTLSDPIQLIVEEPQPPPPPFVNVEYWWTLATPPTNWTNMVGVMAPGFALRENGKLEADNVPWKTPELLTNVMAVDSAYGFTIALNANGTVRAWGVKDAEIQETVAVISNAAAVAAGCTRYDPSPYGLILGRDGNLLMFGANNYGQLDAPILPSNRLVAVAADTYTSAALSLDGRAFVWGGTGFYEVPSDLNDAVALSVSLQHAVALRADGTVVAWGFDQAGETIVPADLSNVVDVAVGDCVSMALFADGSVRQWGGNGDRTWSPNDAKQVAAFSVDNFPAVPMLLLSEGRPFIPPMVSQLKAPINTPLYFKARPVGARPLTCQWYRNGVPIEGATQSLLTWVQTNNEASADFQFRAANAQGTATGETIHVEFEPVSFLLPLEAETPFAGKDWAIEAHVTGFEPFAFQWLKDGRLIPGATTAVFSAQSAQPEDQGAYSVIVSNPYSCLTSSVFQLRVPNVAAWGPAHHVPDDLTNAAGVGAGSWLDFAVRADGSITGFKGLLEMNNLFGITNAAALASALTFGAILHQDGMVTAWTNEADQYQILATGLSNAIAVAAGGDHLVALLKNGTVATFGGNAFGQCDVPEGLANVVAVSAADRVSLAVLADGSIACWGQADYLADPPTNVVSASCGPGYALTVNANGEIEFRGTNTEAEFVPEGNGFSAVSAGYDHAVALREEGSLVAWGDSSYDKLNVPAGLSNVVDLSAFGMDNLALIGIGKPSVAPMVDRITSALGGRVFLKAKPMGRWPLSCQWYKDGEPLAGATHALLAVTVADGGAYGDYYCEVANHLGTATGSVVALRPKGQVRLSAATADAQEGTFCRIKVQRMGDPEGPASVQYWTRSKGALAWKDFTPKVGTLNWGEGETNAKTVKISILPDLEIEGRETFHLLLRNPQGLAAIAPAKTVIAINPGGKGTNVTANASSYRMLRLTAALDSEGLIWFTSPQAPWTAQTAITLDGVDAAVSGRASVGQVSWLETNLDGPGTLSFNWRINGYAGDVCLLMVDGQVVQTFSRRGQWFRRNLALAPGFHTIRWVPVAGSGLPAQVFIDRVSVSVQ